MSCTVEFQNVGKVYKSSRGDVDAVRGVSFKLEMGSFNSIVGPSGCGKSTLLQIAAGLTAASRGVVLLDGVPVTSPPAQAVYLFQQYGKSVFPWKTVQDNVAFGLRCQQARAGHALADSEIRERCRDMIDIVGLTRFSRHYPHELSGGMQQRVAIARALVCRPDVLMMDEPFSAVDALTRTDLQDGLLALWQQFKPTIMFVTHDIDEAIYLSQRVVVLSKPPSTVSRIAEVELPYPRDQVATREAASTLRHRRQILADITSRAPAVAEAL